MEQVPTFDLKITCDNIEESSKLVLKKIRPDWIDNPSNLQKLKTKEFADGITNRLIGFYLQDQPRDTIIFKIYGEKTEAIINRQEEIQTIMLLKTLNLGAQLYGIFSNGIIYEFIPGQTLNEETCQNPTIYPLVATEMAKLHSTDLGLTHFNSNQQNNTGISVEDGNYEPIVWQKLDKFLSLAKSIFHSNPKLESEFREIGITIDWGKASIQEFQDLIAKESMPLVFAHNDLLLGNIIYDEDKVRFIDFEYGGPNYAPFDVANHFNEFAGVDEIDFARYPNPELRSYWIEIYLKNVKNINCDQKTFERWVTLCTPLSHLLWILWCIVQAGSSKLDFDYVNYARNRFPEYTKWLLVVRELFKN